MLKKHNHVDIDVISTNWIYNVIQVFAKEDTVRLATSFSMSRWFGKTHEESAIRKEVSI